ncbi:low affinity immunoglobulin epsilon Fc receptor-like [Microtus ochrogaster]|uniref:low affinity immunoglobulin epsilon Fc receptor-like n=1 Tax=Microtus ochrogaster TaxID=79684 RepID=UPI00067CB0A8|nr:low affinity immunoglobulin epsilon Fc receptor-like [Microtus ochrogaster]
MEDNEYSGYWEPPHKRSCCARRGTQLVLVGLLSTAMWAAVLTLLLLWHWETEKNLKQLGAAAVQNVSHVSQDLQRYQSNQLAQKSQAARMSQSMQELQTEQKQMKTQDSELSQNLNRLQEDLTNIESQNSELSQNLNRLLEDLINIKSQSLNEKRTASDSLEKLQEEVAKLRIEMLLSKGESDLPPQWWPEQQPPPPGLCEKSSLGERMDFAHTRAGSLLGLNASRETEAKQPSTAPCTLEGTLEVPDVGSRRQGVGKTHSSPPRPQCHRRVALRDLDAHSRLFASVRDARYGPCDPAVPLGRTAVQLGRCQVPGARVSRRCSCSSCQGPRETSSPSPPTLVPC